MKRTDSRRPAPLPRHFVDPHMVARATREQRAPVTAHVTARPPAPRGQIAYALLASPLPASRQET